MIAAPKVASVPSKDEDAQANYANLQ